ncbi:phosphopantothenoylcysteine decarboxylase [Echinococcus multilocularis]|uniref:Phosphopantothenoylcysteine decarboxylase n=1 Tax=Echinococcus multilocularis TaxID=6211 RepID=A0A068Y8I9_ECHMU|nr:phosphopantothenoylcysteine decarboxylase [Echinococcus multilocularis]
MEGNGSNVLLGVTGSVAAIKAVELVSCLMQSNFNVKVVATTSACRFFEKSQVGVPVYTDADEYACWKNRGDPVFHVQLRDWADIFLIAPLSANTLAKIAGGFCDNLLTCIARAWHFDETTNHQRKVGIFAPAMNTSMWENPLTSSQVGILCNTLNWIMIDPICKTLMCGDVGQGAMEEPHKIAEFIQNLRH